MPKVKRLLRKLHIGSGHNDHHLSLGHSQPETNPNPNSNPSTASSSSSSSSSGSAPMGRVGAVEPLNDRTAGNGCADFSFLEEEFQLQLALAISASDPAGREDAESAQIDAAKKISMGCSVTDTGGLVDFLSLQYWSYDVVNYDEKVTDGFYDVYGITSNLVAQGKMPLLVDLEAMSVLDNMDYEVTLVNRASDRQLQQLENRVYSISMECQDSDHGLVISGLIQKIADIVVDRMGGPVGDAEEMLKRWNVRSNELRNSLNTVILPLGWIDAGLSRHRALLFKVLADKVNLPCMLVKGSYYTGTDEGAVNLIKFDNGSEYIIDLMGAPGTLIPAEASNSHLPNYALDRKCFADVTESPKNSFLVLDKGIETRGGLPDLDRFSNFSHSVSEEASFIASQTEENEKKLAVKEQTERFEHDIGKLLPSLRKSCESSSSSYGEASHAQKMKVKNVSKYVISAAKNPEFAQKLHAVLLESGASPPPDLVLKPDPLELSRQEVPEQSDWVKRKKLDAGAQCFPDKFLSGREQPLLPYPGVQSADNVGFDNKKKYSVEALAERQKLHTNVVNSNSSVPSDTTRDGLVHLGTGSNESIQFDAAANPCPRQLENAIGSEKIESIFNNIDLAKNSAVSLMETTNIGLHCACNGPSDGNNPVLSEVADWEIPWEDLQIGKRIGIGSFGEVYHADWNDTEVAVKKFLSQDLSGDALIQFKCEVEIMLRLRHPNIVLFMGAVTRPPHLSILTEFLPRGSLYKLLHRPNSQLDEKRRLKMALDVAKGMNYLHTSHPTIVHRDLKSPNLLVDKNWVVKVSDFGLSRLKHHTFLSSKSSGGTPEWMAPEVLRNEPANEKCDIYSFGVILWELATLCVPWSGLNPMQVVGAVGFQNRHLEIPETVDPAIAQIISECWQTEPHLRPSFSQLMSRLRPLQRLVVEREDHPGVAPLYR